MKRLLIIRHAKSNWNFPSLADFDRPLNDRGKHDAPMMAERLLKESIEIDAFVSSTANRALSTATFFIEKFGRKKNHIIEIDELYHAPASLFFSVIKSLNSEFSTVAIFSHNPGITEFVNQITNVKLDNMPTCGIFAVKCNIENWKDFSTNTNAFWFFDYPKNISSNK